MPQTSSAASVLEQPLFINREKELQAFRRLLDLPAGQPLPLLMFHGDEGMGKSWMLRKPAPTCRGSCRQHC